MPQVGVSPQPGISLALPPGAHWVASAVLGSSTQWEHPWPGTVFQGVEVRSLGEQDTLPVPSPSCPRGVGATGLETSKRVWKRMWLQYTVDLRAGHLATRSPRWGRDASPLTLTPFASQQPAPPSAPMAPSQVSPPCDS